MAAESTDPAVTTDELRAITTFEEFGQALRRARNHAGLSMYELIGRGRQRAAQARKDHEPGADQFALTKHIVQSLEKGKFVVQDSGEFFGDRRLDVYLYLCDVPGEQVPEWRDAARRAHQVATNPQSPGTDPSPKQPQVSGWWNRSRRMAIAQAGALVVVAALLIGGGMWVTDRGDDSVAGPGASPPIGSATGQAGPQGRPGVTEGCPHRAQEAPAVADISILAWCLYRMTESGGGESPTRKQMKLRPCITNNSSGELDLGITKTADKSSAMRLLVNAKDLPGSWNPPPATAAAGDRPVQVSWQGHTYWAIPANVPHDAVEVPVIENGQQIGTTWDGFSTIWEDVKLTPENRILYEPIEYGANGWPIQETDLVFNLPGSDASELTIFALAIVDRTNPSIVIAVSPAFDPGGAWPENQWAAYF